MEGKVHELEKIKFGVIPITVYRGCLVTKLIGGWEVWGKRVSTPDEIDQLIDEAGISLKGSITVDAISGSNSCQNTESGIIGSPDDLVG